MAIEIVRTLVGSLGIVAAVPLTTLIAVWLTTERGTPQERGGSSPGRRIEQHLRRPAIALISGILGIGLLTAVVAVVMAPLVVSPPRSAVIPDQFGGTPPPSIAASPEPSTDPGGPEIPDGDAPIIQVGASIPIVDGPAALGSITVLQHRTEEAGAGGTRLLVQVHYRAEQAFDVRPEAWVAIPLEGEAVVGQPATIDPALAAGTRQAGETATGWLEFELPATTSDLFLDYQDSGGTTIFIVALF